jgi:hypothetical protein
LFFLILPFIEQNNLYQSSYDPTGNSSANNKGFPTYCGKIHPVMPVIKTYVCPSDPTDSISPNAGNLTSYAFNGLIFQQYIYGYANYPASISDGTSQTIFFTEKERFCQANNFGNYWPDTIDPAISLPHPVYGLGQEGVGPGNTYFQIMPTQSNCRWDWATTGHTGGIQCAMGDGSVHAVAQGVSTTTWWNALTPAGGEVLGPDW